MELFRAPPEDFLVSSATWLAVLTAAVGLWRIRSVASKSDDPPPSPIPQPSPPPPPAEEIRTTKQRFTMVYSLNSAEDEEGCECGGIVCEESRKEEEEFAGGGEDDGKLVAPLELTEWRGLLTGKRSDFGWYRYQDRTAINGSVVRLWCGGGIRRRM